MTTLRDNYDAGMTAAISDAMVGFRKLAPGRITTAMSLMRMCMDMCAMPKDLIGIISTYMDFIDESSLEEVLHKCEFRNRPWIWSLIITAIGTDNLELFTRLQWLDCPDVWKLNEFETFGTSDFGEFMRVPGHLQCDWFVQFVTNLLCYLGRAGKDSEWVTKFFRERASVKFGITYMVMGSGPVDDIQYNMELACGRFPLNSMIKSAMAGDQNPEIMEFLRRPNPLFQ